MKIKLIIMSCLSLTVFAQDWNFSLGVKFWPSNFETSRADGEQTRTGDGSGSVGGLSMALTREKLTFALTAMTDISEYTPFNAEDSGFDQKYKKEDYDFTVNYSFSTHFGANIGYKRVVSNADNRLSDGTFVSSRDFDMNGLIVGGFWKHQLESVPLVFSAGIGYGFLSTSDIQVSAPGVDFSLDTDDASGIMWEAGANYVVSRVVLSLTYKFQDFKYDVNLDDSTSYETKDQLGGFQLGVRYHF
ncbi:MAG: hypothetical protein H6510_06385 [Acidobacteria bacterium]|nr:hypothetical protein [Acidobacteriota bacterium]MCB9397423.1 hypothetical protein [Acidobacteriota bacterium]